METIQRRLSASLWTCALAALLAPLSTHLAWAQPVKINVGYTTAADFVPLFVAKEKGIFEQHKLDATLTRIALASNVPSAIMSGSLQIGMGTSPMLLQAAEGGLGLVAIAGVSRFKKNNPMAAVVVRPESKIANAGDLRGKKVGVPGLNSMFDVLFRKWLLNNNVQLNQVTFVEAPFPQMKDLLKNGTLDAVLVIEPFRTGLTADKTGYAMADFIGEVKDDILGAFWMATGEWAGKNAQLVRTFREAYAEAIQYSLKNPAEAKAIEAKYLGVAGPVVPSYSVEVSPPDLELFAAISRQIGLLRSPVDVSKLVWK
jgi:NitT/TauT family transport system substrate-binding protein